MYKLLIVEDEKWEREGLVEFIDWTELGISIVGTASNGSTGLRLAKETRPDMILTDIRMPIMDGMELARNIRQFLPDCRIIIITGYDDFEYAKEAIDLGVYDFILKPVQKQQLTDVIKRTVKSISDEIYSNEHVNILKQQITEYLYDDREKFLLKLVQGELPADDLETCFAEKGFAAVIIKFDTTAFFQDMNCCDKKMILRELYVKIRNIVGENGITAQNADEDGEMILCLPSGTDGRSNIMKVLRQIVQTLDRSDVPKAVAGIGSVVKVSRGFPESYRQAKTALEHIFFMERAELLFYDDIPEIREIEEAEIYDFYTRAARHAKEILSGIVSLDAKQLTRLADDLFRSIADCSVDWNHLCSYFAGLTSEISAMMISYDGTFASKLADMDQVRIARGFIKLADMKGWLEKLLIDAGNCIMKKKANKEEHIVEKVMDIIRNEYADSIGIDSIAGRLGLSPNYLGSLFRQHTGKRFTEALTDQRMKAAEELLLSGTVSVVDSARLAGYENAGYFCTVFKRKHGVSPTDFQKRASSKQESSNQAAKEHRVNKNQAIRQQKSIE
jgi:two-component system response regulator YesN